MSLDKQTDDLRFEVSTAVSMKNAVFWDVVGGGGGVWGVVGVWWMARLPRGCQK
jgi:hypothetical protein